VRKPHFAAVRANFEEGGKTGFILRRDIHHGNALGVRMAGLVGIDTNHIDLGDFLAGHESDRSLSVEPHLCRAIDRRHITQDRTRIGPAHLFDRPLDIQNRDAVFPAQSHPQLLAVTRECWLMRFATHQDAAGNTFRVGGRPCRRIGRVADDALVHCVDQINIA
jgi:hypothetical protein